MSLDLFSVLHAAALSVTLYILIGIAIATGALMARYGVRRPVHIALLWPLALFGLAHRVRQRESVVEVYELVDVPSDRQYLPLDWHNNHD